MERFNSYTIDHGIEGLKFLIGSPEGKEWYDPIKPYTLLEYQWVLENVPMDGMVLDCGAHHGHYSIVFGKKALSVRAVDPYFHNIKMIFDNASLNNMLYKTDVEICAVDKESGQRSFDYVSNGRFDNESQSVVDTKTLKELAGVDLIDVVKLDIEGAEFEIIPTGLDMVQPRTWIVEIHPNYGSPELIANLFLEREFELLKVDREKMAVIPYKVGSAWPTHATLIARAK